MGSGLPEGIRSEYSHIRVMPDGRVCGVHRLMFHWTVHVDIDEIGYADRWCFATEDMAKGSLDAWDGTGDMPGDWHKHPKTGRRRDIKTGLIWDENLPKPPLTSD